MAATLVKNLVWYDDGASVLNSAIIDQPGVFVCFTRGIAVNCGYATTSLKSALLDDGIIASTCSKIAVYFCTDVLAKYNELLHMFSFKDKCQLTESMCRFVNTQSQHGASRTTTADPKDWSLWRRDRVGRVRCMICDGHCVRAANSRADIQSLWLHVLGNRHYSRVVRRGRQTALGLCGIFGPPHRRGGMTVRTCRVCRRYFYPKEALAHLVSMHPELRYGYTASRAAVKHLAKLY